MLFDKISHGKRYSGDYSFICHRGCYILLTHVASEDTPTISIPKCTKATDFIITTPSGHVPKLGSILSVVKGDFYTVVVPNETFRGMTYSDLMQDYYNWIYSSNPDVRQDKDIFFLRGNAFGDPYVVPKENTSPLSTYEILTDPRCIRPHRPKGD